MDAINDLKDMFCVFTDGSAINNSQTAAAGWATYFTVPNRLYAKSLIGTNNVAELTAIGFALWFSIKQYNWFKPLLETRNNTIYIFTDSEYSIGAIDKNNKVNANGDLIMKCKRYIADLKTMGISVKFIHVRAHTGKTDWISENNKIVDEAARDAARGNIKK